MAEVAVHFSLATLPRDYILFHIFVPDSTSIKIVQLSDLPADWNTHPPPVSTTRFGDELVRANHYCLLRLPSAVVQGDYNTLINPRHPDFIGIHVVQRLPFTFDNRLFGSR
jgi:RES domain-containing protein